MGRSGRHSRRHGPQAHIEVNEDDSPRETLDELMNDAEEITGGRAGARLTLAFVGRLGRNYPTGYGVVTTLRDLRAAFQQVAGRLNLHLFRGSESRRPSDPQSDFPIIPAFYRFVEIVTDGGVERPWDITDIWLEDTSFVRDK